MATATATAAHLTKAQVRNLRRAQKRHAGNNKTADGVEETKSSDNADVSVAPAEEKQDQPMLKTFRALVTTNLPSDMIVLETDPATPNFVPDADAQTVRNAGQIGRA